MGFTPFTQIPYDLLRAAVAVAAVLIGFLVWRWHPWARREGVDHKLSTQRTLHNQGTSFEEPLAIFLSHSGKQKAFVEHLYDALKMANQTVFFDKHSLPKGSQFPPHIKRAAHGCKLGVVVLSEDFLTSKWPMLELDMLVLQKGPNAKVLPLFFMLHPKDLKSSTNLSKWRDVWKKKGGVDAQYWEQAVKELGSFNGEVFIPGSSEVSYIKNVVKRICNLVPSNVPYDLSFLQGHDRLARETASQFEHLNGDKACMVGLHGVAGLGKTTLCKLMVNIFTSNYVGRSCLIEFPTNGDKPLIFQECKRALKKLANLTDTYTSQEVHSFDQETASQFEHLNGDKACMVGLHGVAGLGKTTLCKLMVNFFTSNYVGRSCLIEFPTNGDKSQTFQECKRALKKLANLTDTYISQEVHSFDQVVELMRNRVRQYDVFLALDNVWESSQEEAKRLLGVEFSARSRILVTSRSEQLLRDMLRGVNTNTRVGPLPAPEQDEALQIFQTTCKQGDLKSLVDKTLITRALKRCMFSGNYHPLALKALGFYVKSACAFVGAEEIGRQMSGTLSDLSNEGLQDLDRLISLNYEMLPEHKQHMFLDIAVTMKYIHVEGFNNRSYASAHRWLCFLYVKRFSETYITRLIYELALNGLIRIVEGDGEKFIKVHDLYCDLAEREAANSCRFFVEGLTRSADGMEWGKLERVVLSGNKHPGYTILEKLQQQACPKLQVLYASGISTSSRGIRLHLMPSLCVLILKEVMRNTVRADYMYRTVSADNSGVLAVGCLLHLQMLCVESCHFVERITGLEALHNLQRLQVRDCRNVQLDLSSVRYVQHGRSIHVKQMPVDLSRLETLDLYDVRMFPEVARLGSALKHVRVKVCKGLKKMENLSSLRCLESLQLVRNEELEEVEGECLSSTLKDLFIKDCKRLRKFPSLKDCAQLQTLAVHGCASIKKMDVECLGSLEGIWISRCEALEEIGDLSALPRLEHVRITECPRLKKVGDFSAQLASRS